MASTLTQEDFDAIRANLASDGVDFNSELSFPQSDDKFLVMDSDGKGKYIETEKLVQYLKSHEASPSRSAILDLINRNEFKNVYSIGDAIMDTFTIDGTTYSYPMLVVDNDKDFVAPDGTTLSHRAQMMPLFSLEFGIPWSNYRAFLRCPSGLAAGSYKVTFAQAWSKLTSDMLTWSFTLTKAVPTGGRIAGFRNFADGQSNKNILVYDAEGREILETVTAVQGEIDGATDLGTMNYTTRNGNLNCMQETFFGWNNGNCLTQWLNSDADVGLWWVQIDDWDCAPDELSTKKGYLAYLDPEHVAMMKTVQVKTLYNTVQGHSASEYKTEYLRAYPPSLEEMYIQPYNTAGVEGEYLPYFKELLGTDSPVAKYQTYHELIAYTLQSKSAVTMWTRSCSRGYAYREFYCYSSGVVYDYRYSRDAFRVRPLEVW